MVLPPRRPSAGMRSIRRELERRRAKPQAPKRPAALKPSAPPPPPPASREGAHGKVRKTCACPVREDPSSIISTMAESGSSSTNPPPSKRPRLQAPPCASLEVSPVPPPPSRYAMYSIGSVSTSVHGAAAHLNPIHRPRSLASPVLPPPIGSSSVARSTSADEARTARHLKLLAPKRASAKKPTAPLPPRLSSPREGVRGKVRKPCSGPVCENSSGTNPSPAKRPRLQAPSPASFQVSPLPPSPRSCRYVSSSVRSAAPAPSAAPPPTGSSSAVSTCTAAGITASHLKPGTRVAVRTRTRAVMIDGRTLVVWLPATVVSSTDRSYEVIYEGELPRNNPFSTVDVPLHHVRPIKQSKPTVLPPPSQPPAAVAASLSASASNPQATAPRSLKMLPRARPTTAGKSLRLISSISPVKQQALKPTTAGKSLRFVRDPAAGKKPAPRPTTAGKRISVIRKTLSEKDRQVLDASCTKLGFLVHE